MGKGKTGMNFEKHCTKYKNKDGQDQVRAQTKGGERSCTRGVIYWRIRPEAGRVRKRSDDPGQEAVSAQFQRSPSHWFNLKYKLKCRKGKK